MKGGIALDNELTLQEVMQLHTKYLFRIAYYYTKNVQVAEDVVQDTFVKFYHTKKYSEKGELKAYLARMTINRCKDYLKSWSHRKIQLESTFFPQKHYIQRDSLVEADENELLDVAILSLPLKQREAIVYFYLENMQSKDIAKLLGISENTVKSRLRSGKAMLRERLQHIEWEVLLDE